MRVFRAQVAALAALHTQADDAELALAFRQGMASLSQVAVDPAAVPFEGLDPEQLLLGVRASLAHKLLDDLSFLAPAGAACALYALASALPALSPERRELGRRVHVHLHQGDLQSFVALATALALSGTRAFEGASTRARLELAVALPAGAVSCLDPLAFALLSRRELAARFLLQPATGALPARRSAARLLELAARHAALRAQQGDAGELAVFEAAHVQLLFAQLAGDREPLVARHAASARGLLSVHVARLGEELERDLMATQSLSRTRRGASSLAARIALRPSETLERAKELLDGPALSRDAGLGAALIYGLPRAFELEPEASEQLALMAVERGGLLAAEALLELRRELFDPQLCLRASEVALKHVQRSCEKVLHDDGQAALLSRLRRELTSDAPRSAGLPELVADAALLHADAGPLAALDAARDAVNVAGQYVEQLARLHEDESSVTRQQMFKLLNELDLGLLESSALFALLAASGTAEAARVSGQLTAHLTQLLHLLLERETVPHDGGAEVAHLTLRMRRLRTLLHLLDTDFRAPEEQSAVVRAEQLSAARRLFDRVALDSSSAMDRIVHAGLARGIDALVREETLEPADVLLCSASAVQLPEGLNALAEGCLLPDLRSALRALAELSRALEGTPLAVTSALSALAHALPSDDTPRTEALRRSLLGLTRACEAISNARSVRELVRARRALSLFEGAVVELAYLSRGAHRRLGLELGRGGSRGSLDEGCVAALARALESHAAQGEPHDLELTLEWLDRELAAALPAPFARAVMRVLTTLRERPLDGVESLVYAALAPASTQAFPLPPWMPCSRRLGDYVVLRPLGGGLACSAFLVKHRDARHEPSAPELVLKVPRYDASTARMLSLEELEEAFADELPALLNVRPHDNLATFVNVEPRSRPKPFLVMRWVEGPCLARVRKRKLDALSLLDGVLAGLDALHQSGVGHLDLSPHNIVLRVQEGVVQPVLVDFGLAGRKPRAGCFHAAYAAPERWASEPTTPMALDVYAVGCLAYELVTGRALFHAASERELAALHANPEFAASMLAELAKEPARAASLASFIALCLRADPSARPSASELRSALRGLAP